MTQLPPRVDYDHLREREREREMRVNLNQQKENVLPHQVKYQYELKDLLL